MVRWIDEKRFSVSGVNFRVASGGEGYIIPTRDEFVVFKDPWMINRYEKLISKVNPKNIFELGIQRGGSCVLFHKLANAEKLIAIELDHNRLEVVDDYISQNQISESLRLFYGVNQADKGMLKKILSSELGTEQLDLVIDDASHFLDETRDSFNILFPRLRNGGAYVIEDWPWAHGRIDQADDVKLFWPEREPMTKLIFELILACPSTVDLIEEIVIDKNSATIWRGKGSIDGNDFDVRKCSLARGRQLIEGGC
jgi:hypothetical protein